MKTCTRWTMLVVCSFCIIGCGGIGATRRFQATDLFAAWKSSLGEDALSPRTLQTLRAWDLEKTYDKDPVKALASLEQITENSPHPDLIFALSELSYQLGKQTENRACARSLDFYYRCAGYAYHYLFGSSTGSEPTLRSSPFDPRFRAACDLYNASVTKCLRAAQKVGRLDLCKGLNIPTCDRQGFKLTVVKRGFPWKAEDFGEILFCEDYEAKGLVNHHRTYGLGVPLIAVRPQSKPPAGHRYPGHVSFPVTAFFRFQGSLRDLRASRTGQLELHNPLAVQSIQVGSRKIPLETDLTTPLAYFLQQNDLSGIGIKGLLSPEKVEAGAGLYMLEPYQPGKIPVVMVHGLLSSPVTWAPMFNDLRADPRIREKYQFWFYFYPTAHPYLTSAANLRESLTALRQQFSPQGQDLAMDNMILVGHSMGGLVSKLLTVDSKDDFWKLVSNEKFETLALSPETKSELKRIFFFQRLPFVKRVVYLGTPHRGSRLSPSFAGQLLRRFISLPEKVIQLAQEVGQAGGKTWYGDPEKGAPTSIDLLAPGSAALELLASRRKPQEIGYHSVVGVAESSSLVYLARFIAGEETDLKGDGVVPYTSAHLEDADTERVVPAEHTQVHQHPLAVQEVRHILLQHAQGIKGRVEPVAKPLSLQPTR